MEVVVHPMLQLMPNPHEPPAAAAIATPTPNVIMEAATTSEL
jgi:hypothetical protein